MKFALGDNERGLNRSSMFRSSSKRFPSPSPSPSPSPQKRSQSAERRRPTTTPSPFNLSSPRPSTPSRETIARLQSSVRKPERPWPAAMKSLLSSFQAQRKKPEKTASNSISVVAQRPGLSPCRRPSSPAVPRKELTRACSLPRPSSPQNFSSRKACPLSPCSGRHSSPLPLGNGCVRKETGFVDDGFKLRMLYNRFLQWRFVNSRASSAVVIRKRTAERIMHSVERSISDIRESVIKKRIQVQRLRREMKLSSILDQQVQSMGDWVSLEREHSCSLTGLIDSLRATTLPLPLEDGAKADIDGLKQAISSATDILRNMCSPIRHLQSKLKGVNSVMYELTKMANQERRILDECWKLLASNAGLQVQECSLRAQLLQLRQDR